MIYLLVSCTTATDSKDDSSNWSIVTYSLDQFPENINFTTDSHIYELNVDKIFGTLTNISHEPVYEVDTGLTFELIKLVSNEWRIVPFKPTDIATAPLAIILNDYAVTS